jgi:hypothetical protein
MEALEPQPFALATKKRYQPPTELLNARYFVTADGFYRFIESATNNSLLEGIKPNTAISVKRNLRSCDSLLMQDEAVTPCRTLG